MDDRESRLARTLAYAGMVCGAAFACLFLLSSAAEADAGSGQDLPGAVSEPQGPVQSVGRVISETGRSSVGRAGDVVRDVAAHAPTARPVADKTTEVAQRTDTVLAEVEPRTAAVDEQVATEVAQRTDTVVAEVEPRTAAVDEQVEGVVGLAPPVRRPAREHPPAAGPLAEEPASQTPSPGKEQAQRREDRDSRHDSRTDRDRPEVTVQMREAVSGAPGRFGDAQPLPIGAPAETPPAAIAGQDAAPLMPLGSCEACAAASGGTTAELPTLQGLVGRSPLDPPGREVTCIERAQLGPAAAFACPEESPD